MARRGSPMSEAQVYAKLAELGIAKVIVHFSGGNDEGGADGHIYQDAKGKQIDRLHSVAEASVSYGDFDDAGFKEGDYIVYTGEWEMVPVPERRWTNSVTGVEQVYPAHERSRQLARAATDGEIEWAKLREALDAPIYARFGSFAGEFEVDGDLVWDVAARTHSMSGQERVYSTREW